MLGNFQQNSRILILCIYSLSNVYNNYKKIQNIKNWLRPPPPGGGGVWCDTPAVNLNHRLIDGNTVYIINTEVPALGDSLS